MFAKAHRLALGGVVLAGCLLVPASAQDTKPGHAAVTPADRLKQKGWKDRHEKFLARAKKGDVDVLFLGDSITQGWEGAGKKVWAEHFAPLKAANFGIGGDRTEHVLWRITRGKELEGIDPKVAVLMIGTNNAGANTAAQIAEGVTAIVKELRRQKPTVKVLVLGVFPRANPREIEKTATHAPKEKLNRKIKEINAIIARLDDGKDVKFLDIGDKFLDKEGNLPRATMPDYLHLSPAGYQIWAEAVKPEVQKLLK